ncbi:Bifunctional inhibitor/plant lipid transfer protein/seed storage helical domain-containing protein, partial [Cynara cardunculus var. scolymus]
MAPKRQEVMGVVLVMMVMVWGGARAQSSGCTNTLMGLASCLNYVTGNTSTPSPSCCSQLSTVVQSQPLCLCSLLNGNGPNIGVTINQTLAITLPGACKVQTPPISRCNASSPTGSTGSEIVPSQETPEAEAPTTSSTPTTTSVVMPWVETTAQPGCMIAFIGLAPCLSSVSGNSSTPSSACCSQLSNIVQVQPQCLCSLVNGGGTANLGISINQTLALSLPRACNVQTPPVSQCNGVANGPTPSSAKSDKIPEAPT